MRELDVKKITEAVKELCISANLELSPEMKECIADAKNKETNVLAKEILGQLQENMDIAISDSIPICQDTGMAVFFIEIGQELHITGGDLTEAVNEGVRQGYTEGYLRKSVVGDPLLRENTRDNTPAIIHYEIVSGDNLKITITPKGFGSENMSVLKMLKPADGVEGVKQVVIDAAKNAGPNACPPFVIGVGIGGDFELVAKLAKKALTREPGSHNSLPHIAKLETELLEAINNLDIGPAGLGGNTTALAVNIETYATHIAGLPVAVNMCCHVDRHKTVIL
ncbi:MAG: fumarate hydratase [Eubacterium sp.]|nr:fumarate hydratase [Eubacterium sp.]